MKTHLLILLFVFITCVFIVGCVNDGNYTHPIKIPFIATYQIEELDTLRLYNINSESLIFLLGQASVLGKDTASIENVTKSKIIYGVVSDYLSDEFYQGHLNIEDENIKFIINLLELNKFHLNLNPPSDFDKFFHYWNSQNYNHIWSRFVGKGYHFYVIIFILVIVISIIIYYKFKN